MCWLLKVDHKSSLFQPPFYPTPYKLNACYNVRTLGGLHRTPEEINFGTLTSVTEKRPASLLLLNSGSSPVQVKHIYAIVR